MKIDASDITRNLNADLKLTLDVVKKEVVEDATIILNSVKEDTPVVSGTARDGWVIGKDGENTTVENEVPYIGFLDEGTDDTSGIHMVDKAIQKVESKP